MSGNGNGKKDGIIHAGLDLAGKITHSLAPQFLALILVNILFLGVLFWFISARAEHTAVLLNQLLNNCIERLQQHP